MNRGAWQGNSPWSHKMLDMTEQLKQQTKGKNSFCLFVIFHFVFNFLFYWYNWPQALYEFKVYSLRAWLTYMWNDYHIRLVNTLLLHTTIFCSWGHLQSTVLAALTYRYSFANYCDHAVLYTPELFYLVLDGPYLTGFIIEENDSSSLENLVF